MIAEAPRIPPVSAARKPRSAFDIRLNPRVTAVDDTRPPVTPVSPSPREPNRRTET